MENSRAAKVFFMDKEPGEGGLFMEQRGGAKALRLDLVVSHDLAEKEALIKFF